MDTHLNVFVHGVPDIFLLALFVSHPPWVNEGNDILLYSMCQCPLLPISSVETTDDTLFPTAIFRPSGLQQMLMFSPDVSITCRALVPAVRKRGRPCVSSVILLMVVACLDTNPIYTSQVPKSNSLVHRCGCQSMWVSWIPCQLVDVSRMPFQFYAVL
jgi:hypothetical protein